MNDKSLFVIIGMCLVLFVYAVAMLVATYYDKKALHALNQPECSITVVNGEVRMRASTAECFEALTKFCDAGIKKEKRP